MDERYENEGIKQIWSKGSKLLRWQKLELAVIGAMAELGHIESVIYEKIFNILGNISIDISWWEDEDKKIHHDYNAAVFERTRHLPVYLRQYYHKWITSYDGQEAPFASMLLDSLAVVENLAGELEKIMINQARKYRYQIMMSKTHYQDAELMSFGKRWLSWLQDFRIDLENLRTVRRNLRFSKISGAIGNYGLIDPEVERVALLNLGFEPYYGATQIMPREIYAPLAQALAQLVATLNKIAMAIRLGARSGRTIYREPFKKRQTGSSAMPHKRNPIRTEQLEGMERMARNYLNMIMENIKTAEERTIEQSCVERVAWPDLFHVVVHSLKVMSYVLSGLVVYPETMLREVVESRGCYASSEVKEFLKEKLLPYGIDSDQAYRIVQLAAFLLFEPHEREMELRQAEPNSLDDADALLEKAWYIKPSCASPISIREFLPRGGLQPLPEQLEATEEDVAGWKKALDEVFSEPQNLAEWNKLFKPSNLLKNEAKLYWEILGE